MNTAVNILQNKFGGSKNLPTFVVPNRAKIVESEHKTYLAADNTAGFLRQFYFDSLARFGKTSKGLRSFVTYIPTNFYLTMPNRVEVSSAGTKCVRSARPTVRKSVKSIRTKPVLHLYQALNLTYFLQKDLETKESLSTFAAFRPRTISANNVEVFFTSIRKWAVKILRQRRNASAICTCSWSNEEGLTAFLVPIHIVNFI